MQSKVIRTHSSMTFATRCRRALSTNCCDSRSGKGGRALGAGWNKVTAEMMRICLLLIGSLTRESREQRIRESSRDVYVVEQIPSTSSRAKASVTLTWGGDQPLCILPDPSTRHEWRLDASTPFGILQRISIRVSQPHNSSAI